MDGAAVGFTGNSLDAVLVSIQDGFIPTIGKTVGGVTLPSLIVRDSRFPLWTWLMKPFTNAVLTPQQQCFNYHLSRACMVIEGAYGQLKDRWMVLLRKSESSRDVVCISRLAGMILHNICHAMRFYFQKDGFELRWKWSKEKPRGNWKTFADERFLKHQGCLTSGK